MIKEKTWIKPLKSFFWFWIHTDSAPITSGAHTGNIWLFVCWNKTQKTILRLLCCDGSKPLGPGMANLLLPSLIEWFLIETFFLFRSLKTRSLHSRGEDLSFFPFFLSLFSKTLTWLWASRKRSLTVLEQERCSCRMYKDCFYFCS